MSKSAKSEKFYDTTFYSIYNEKKVLRTFMKNLRRGDTVVDLGAGTSPYKDELLSTGVEYISVDFSGNQDYIIDLNNGLLPFKDKSINAITLFQVLEHIHNTEHLLKEVDRILKPGGYLFISTPFIFPLHGIPHDHHRYTKYFYERVATDYSYSIGMISSGVYGLGNIFYLINIMIGYYSFWTWYRLLISPLIIINNVIIGINNLIVQFLPNILKFPFKESVVSDYALFYKKSNHE